MFRLLGSHRPRSTCAKSASVIGALVLPLLVAPPLVPLLASVRRRPKWVAVGGVSSASAVRDPTSAERTPRIDNARHSRIRKIIEVGVSCAGL